MRLRLRVVGEGHYVVTGAEYTQFGPSGSKKIPRAAQSFWYKYGLGDADEAVIARHDGKLVAFFRYIIDSESTLIAAGTWVAPAFRRKGLATRMWKIALKRHRVLLADVYAATRAGASFIKSLRDKELIEEV